MSTVDLRALVDPTAYLRSFGALPSGPASQFTVVAFDDFIQSDSATVAVASNPALDNILGVFDQLAIDVETHHVRAGVAPVSLTVRIQHSADAIHWFDKGPAPEISEPSVLSGSGPTYMNVGYDDGSMPSLAFVRLMLNLSAPAGPVTTYVKIHVTANDLHERDFSAEVAKYQAAFDLKSYDERYPAGTSIAAHRIPEVVSTTSLYRYIDWTRSTRNLLAPDGYVVFKRGVTVCFNASGHYVLLLGDALLFRPYAPADPIVTTPGSGPGVHTQPIDPDVKFREGSDRLSGAALHALSIDLSSKQP